MVSGNPADRKKKKTNTKKKKGPTSAAAWKAGTGVEEVTVPSGNVALVKRVGPEAFLSTGIVPDTLTPLIDEAIKDKKGLPPAKVAKQLKDDPDSLPAMIDMMNRVVAYAVIKPHVEVPPDCIAEVEVEVKSASSRKTTKKEICGKSFSHASHNKDNEGNHKFLEPERDEDLLYADDILLDDRVFIMNFCVGGTRDLATFRGQHRESMARLADEQDVED